jgi:hypothetical protein
MTAKTYWMGTPMEELSREELLTVVNHLAREVVELRADRERMRPNVDWAGYLMTSGVKSEHDRR